ncbi:hypothetical protein QQG74_07575 [Micromonospora sp. FIMYZ51]|uniref:hypothetical protein n=1 Tax=Micromonospora sp. FIMYZ51 TaxID=3051832 RepID=UPI00311F432C
MKALDRADETVWTFPDTGVPWSMSSRFEQFSSSLEDFFLEGVAGRSYLTLNGAFEGDQWWRLLNRIGRI